MKTWAQKYQREILGDVGLRVRAARSPELDDGWLSEQVNKVRKRTLNREECGLPGGGVENGTENMRKVSAVNSSLHIYTLIE